MPLLTGLRVTHSAIHGYGVVTTRRFTKGERIVEGDGVMYDADADFDDTYALILPGPGPDGEDDATVPPLFLDLCDQTRWINHACSPNTEIDSRFDAELGRVRAWWLALRDIELGEELTYDYGFDGQIAERCACGSPDCRGLIVDPDPESLRGVPAELRPFLRAPLLQAAG